MYQSTRFPCNVHGGLWCLPLSFSLGTPLLLANFVFSTTCLPSNQAVASLSRQFDGDPTKFEGQSSKNQTPVIQSTRRQPQCSVHGFPRSLLLRVHACLLVCPPSLWVCVGSCTLLCQIDSALDHGCRRYYDNRGSWASKSACGACWVRRWQEGRPVASIYEIEPRTGSRIKADVP